MRESRSVEGEVRSRLKALDFCGWCGIIAPHAGTGGQAARRAGIRALPCPHNRIAPSGSACRLRLWRFRRGDGYRPRLGQRGNALTFRV